MKSYLKNKVSTFVLCWTQIFALLLAPIAQSAYAADGDNLPTQQVVPQSTDPSPTLASSPTIPSGLEEVDRTLELLNQAAVVPPSTPVVVQPGTLDQDISHFFFFADQRSVLKTPRGIFKSTLSAMQELLRAGSAHTSDTVDFLRRAVTDLPAKPAQPTTDIKNRIKQLNDAVVGKAFRMADRFPRLSGALSRLGLHLPEIATEDSGRVIQYVDPTKDPNYLSPAALLFVKSTNQLKVTVGDAGAQQAQLKIVFQAPGHENNGSFAEVDLPPNIVPKATVRDGEIGSFLTEKGELYAFFLYSYRFSFGRQPLLVAKIRDWSAYTSKPGRYSIEVNNGPFSSVNAVISDELRAQYPDGAENGGLFLIRTGPDGKREFIRGVERKELLAQLSMRHILAAMILKSENPDIKIPNFSEDLMTEVKKELDEHPEILDLAKMSDYEGIVRVLQAKTVNETLTSLKGALAQAQTNRKVSWDQYIHSSEIHLTSAAHYILSEVFTDDGINPDAAIDATSKTFKENPSKLSDAEKEIVSMYLDTPENPYDSPSARIVSGALWELKTKIDAYVDANQLSPYARSLQNISARIETTLVRSPTAKALAGNLEKLRKMMAATPNLSVSALLSTVNPDDDAEMQQYIDGAQAVHPAMQPALKRFFLSPSGEFVKKAFKLVIDPSHALFLSTIGLVFSGALIERGLKVPPGTGSAFIETCRPVFNWFNAHVDTITAGNYRPWLALSMIFDFVVIKSLKGLYIAYSKAAYPNEHPSFGQAQVALGISGRVGSYPLFSRGFETLTGQHNITEALVNGFHPSFKNGGLHGYGSAPNLNYDLFGLSEENQAVVGLISENLIRSKIPETEMDVRLESVIAKLREKAAFAEIKEDAVADQVSNEEDSQVLALISNAQTQYVAGVRPDFHSIRVRNARARLLNSIQERNSRLATLKAIGFKAALEAEGIQTGDFSRLVDLEMVFKNTRQAQEKEFSEKMMTILNKIDAITDPAGQNLTMAYVESQTASYKRKISDSNSRIQAIQGLVSDQLEGATNILKMRFSEGLSLDQFATLQTAALGLAKERSLSSSLGLSLKNLVGRAKFWLKYRSAAILTYPLGLWEAAGRAIPNRANSLSNWNQWEVDMVLSFPLEGLIGNKIYSMFGLPHIGSRADLDNPADLAARPSFISSGTPEMPGSFFWNNTDKLYMDSRQNFIYSVDVQARSNFEFGGGKPDNIYAAAQIVPKNQQFEGFWKSTFDVLRAVPNFRQTRVPDQVMNAAKNNIRFAQSRFLFYGTLSHFIQGIPWVDGLVQELFFRWNAWQAFAWPWSIINGSMAYVNQSYLDLHERYSFSLSTLNAALEEARLYTGEKSENNSEYRTILNKARISFYELSQTYKDNRRSLPGEKEIVGAKTLDELTTNDLTILANNALQKPAATEKINQSVNKTGAIVGGFTSSVLAIPFTIAVAGAKLTRADKLYRAAKGMLFFPLVGIGWTGYQWVAARLIDPVKIRLEGAKKAYQSSFAEKYSRDRSYLLTNALLYARVNINKQLRAGSITDAQAGEKIAEVEALYNKEIGRTKVQRDKLLAQPPKKLDLLRQVCSRAISSLVKAPAAIPVEIIP